MIHDEVKSFALATLIYRFRSEDDTSAIEAMQHFFPGIKVHLFASKGGDHVFGIAYHPKSGKCYIVNRGTGGFNWYNRIQSWITDFTFTTSGDGVADGFQLYGDECIDALKPYLWYFDVADCAGHSQGAILTPYVMALLRENFKFKTISGYGFAGCPVGNELFKKRFDAHGDKYKMLMVDGDPLGAKIFRSKLTGGVDVGETIELPKPVQQPLGAFFHSPGIYNFCMMIRCCKDMGYSPANVELLAGVNEWLIN